MIKFFQRIRRRLLVEGKTGRYFKYALGEIILVVIGILIALQVNMWNETRKARKQEVKIYKEIKNDLVVTGEEVLRDMESHEDMMKSSKNLLDHLLQKKSNNDSLVYNIFGTIVDLQVYPKTSGYDALNSIGLDLLRNDSLRILITELYQLKLKRVVQRGKEETQTTSYSKLLANHILGYLEIDNQSFRTRNYAVVERKDSIEIFNLKVNNYQTLLDDKELHSKINRTLYWRQRTINTHNWVYNGIQETVQAIEKELELIEN